MYIQFVNTKQFPDPVTISLEATKTMADNLANLPDNTQFTFMLEAVSAKDENETDINFTVSLTAPAGSEISLEDYKGKVLLIVNTATGCGFTPQYDELQDLYELHQKDGLEILDFPCNQFANQAPGSDEEIHDFCTGRYGITFPQFSKIDVLGDNADPLFKYLSENTTFEGFKAGPLTLILEGAVKKIDKDFKNNSNIKWNFTKFLIDRSGEIVARFEPTAAMKGVKAKVEEVL